MAGGKSPWIMGIQNQWRGRYGRTPRLDGDMGGRRTMMWGWDHGAWGAVWMLLSWGLLAVAIYLIVRAVAGGTGDAGGSRKARDILEERFARGEISAEEFEERKRVLERSPR